MALICIALVVTPLVSTLTLFEPHAMLTPAGPQMSMAPSSESVIDACPALSESLEPFTWTEPSGEIEIRFEPTCSVMSPDELA